MENINEIERLVRHIMAEIPYIDVEPYSHNIVSLDIGVLQAYLTLENMKFFLKKSGLLRKGWTGYESCSEERYRERQLEQIRCLEKQRERERACVRA